MILRMFTGLLLLVLALGCSEGVDQKRQAEQDVQDVPMSAELADLFYDYAYPLVIMKISQDMMLTAPFRPPSHPNQFIHFKRLAMPQNKAVVLGNRNTLYSVGWVDLSAGPVLFEIPDMADRYYVMPLLDAWTNTFRSLGSRTTGQGAQKYLLVSEQDRHQTLEGYETIVSPTDMVWITGRIQADDPQDAQAAGLLQDQYRLRSLAVERGQEDPLASYEPMFSATQVKKPVPFSLNLSAGEFYDVFFEMWPNNPPLEGDAPFLARIAEYGIEPQSVSTYDELPEPVRKALAEAAAEKQAGYLAAFYEGESQTTPWIFNREAMGTWGSDYGRRAYWAMWGLGANLVEDAVYGVSQLDAQLQTLDGASQYKIHFAAGQTPPTSAFWSVTLYDIEGYLEANDSNRYSLGSNHTLHYNKDGSLDFVLAHERPSGESVNWVPAPAAEFKVLLRIYWPGESVLAGNWALPPIEKFEHPQ